MFTKEEARQLISAIVLQAVEDWRTLIRESAKDKDYDEIREFFRSKWGEMLCDELQLDASFILRKLERELEAAR